MKKKHLFGKLTLQTKDLSILNDETKRKVQGGATPNPTDWGEDCTISVCNDQCPSPTGYNWPEPGCPSNPDPMSNTCCVPVNTGGHTQCAAGGCPTDPALGCE